MTVRLTPSVPVSEDEVLTTFPLLTCRSMPVEELNVVLLVPVSKLVDEVPSFARLAVSVPPVTDMLALTPLLVSIATVRPASIEKFDLPVPELPALVVLTLPPLRVNSR